LQKFTDFQQQFLVESILLTITITKRVCNNFVYSCESIYTFKYSICRLYIYI